MKGRVSGSIGARKAAEYLANQLEAIGYFPKGDNGFFQQIDVPAARLKKPVSLTISDEKLTHRVDFAELT